MPGTNWNNPTLTSNYSTNLLQEIKARDESLATQFNSSLTADTNIPVNTVRWNATNKNWELWSGATWGALAGSQTYGISVTGTAANLSGTPALPNGTTGTTQAAGDNSTKLATTAFVAANFAPMGTGTRMAFNQTAAPTGWTKDTTAALNDSIMRIVTGTVGSGGSTAFSTFNGQTATAAYTLTTPDIPSHTHTGPSHTHTGVTDGSSALMWGSMVSNFDIADVGTAQDNAHPATNHNHTFTTDAAGNGATGSTGGGSGHSHGITTAIKYNDFIIASKN